MAQEGLVLTEAQLAALEKAKSEKESHGEFESECPAARRQGKLHRGFSEALSSLMWARLIILRYPAIEVGLPQLGDRPVQGFAERHAIELVKHRFVEPLANTICLRALRFGA